MLPSKAGFCGLACTVCACLSCSRPAVLAVEAMCPVAFGIHLSCALPHNSLCWTCVWSCASLGDTQPYCTRCCHLNSALYSFTFVLVHVHTLLRFLACADTFTMATHACTRAGCGTGALRTWPALGCASCAYIGRLVKHTSNTSLPVLVCRHKDGLKCITSGCLSDKTISSCCFWVPDWLGT